MATTPVCKITDKRLAVVKRWLSYPGPVVYFIGWKRGEMIKIGFASNLANRLRALQTGSSVKLEVLAALPGGVEQEREYHRRFRNARAHGEWFYRTPEVRQEMSRLQELGPPSSSQEELAQRAANIKAYFRAESERRRAASRL